MSTFSAYNQAPSQGQAQIRLENVALRFRLYNDRSPFLKQFIINKVFRRTPMKAKSEFWIYDGLNLTIEHGERLGIIGSNGAGKSTMLKMISGIYYPTSGTVRVCGRIAPLLELGAGFNPELSGVENIYLNGAFLGFSHREMATKVERILDFAELREFSQTPIKYYSSGMMLRLAFSVATDMVPEILLIDEIFSAGDASFVGRARARMKSLMDTSHIVVLVSHDLNLIKEMSQRVIWLKKGKVEMDGDPATVCEAYLNEQVPGRAAALT
jgi:lipopolysaccharide transport system ATP-binding protein